MRGYIESGRREGGRILTGGDRICDEGFFIQPAVVTDTRPDMSVVREEIFGPVVCAMPFDDDLGAIAHDANDSDGKGLYIAAYEAAYDIHLKAAGVVPGLAAH